ncbi:hypothetical protein HOD08_04790 [bacterium]|nr:hypothetical protein [bacterium]
MRSTLIVASLFFPALIAVLPAHDGGEVETSHPRRSVSWSPTISEIEPTKQNPESKKKAMATIRKCFKKALSHLSDEEIIRGISCSIIENSPEDENGLSFHDLQKCISMLEAFAITPIDFSKSSSYELHLYALETFEEIAFLATMKIEKHVQQNFDNNQRRVRAVVEIWDPIYFGNNLQATALLPKKLFPNFTSLLQTQPLPRLQKKFAECLMKLINQYNRKNRPKKKHSSANRHDGNNDTSDTDSKNSDEN